MGNQAARSAHGDGSLPPVRSPASSPGNSRRTGGKKIMGSGLSLAVVEDMMRKTAEKKDWRGLQKLLQSHSDVVTQCARDPDQEPPTLRALRVHAPTFVIETIISVEVMQVNRPDSNGDTVMHYATMHQATLSTIVMILQYDPQSKSRSNKEGYLPLHLACKYGSSVEVIDHLLKSYPTAAETKLPTGQLPLHIAAQNRQSSVVLAKLVAVNPAAVKSVYQGDLPIHAACRAKPNGSVVKALLEPYPDSIQVPGNHEMLPIHCAVASKCTADAVTELVRGNVDTLLLRDKTYRMALHYALELQCKDDIVTEIIKACPDTARHRGRGTPGEFPLAIAVEQGFSKDVVIPIMRCYPEALRVKSVQNMYVLRNAMKRKLEVEIMSAFLEEFPAAAAEEDEHGRLALHYAVSRLYPCALIDSLVRAHPLGVSTQDHNRQCPMHLLAVRAVQHIQTQDPGVYSNYLEILALLVDRFPGAASLLDKYGLSTVNYLIENNSPLDLVERFLAASSSSLSIGKVPLHHAIECKRDTRMISLLLDHAKASASLIATSCDDMLALHMAILRPLPLEALLLIQNAYPAACRHRDSSGKLPIHHALQMHTDISLVKLLIQDYPAVVHELAETPSDGDEAAIEQPEGTASGGGHPPMTPLVYSCCTERRLLHAAISHRCKPSVVAEILQYTMPIQPRSEELNLLHYGHWFHLLAHTNDEYWQSVELVLQWYSQASIYKLSQWRDVHTHKALDVATPRCRDVIVHRLHYFSRYELKNFVAHRTDFALHKHAVDHLNGTKQPVVLKFFASLEGFQAEIRARDALKRYHDSEGIDSSTQARFILPLVCMTNGDEDYNYRAESQLKSFGSYPYLIVTRRAVRSLGDVIRQDNVSNRGEDKLREYARQLCEAMEHLHKADVVHGNWNAFHVFELDGRLVIGDFTLASDLRHDDMIAFPAMGTSARHAMSCAPPEVAAFLMPSRRPNPPPVAASSQHNTSLAPTKSMDIWSLGAILYHLATGEPLFLADCHNDIDYDQVEMLARWPELVKKRRLQRIPFPVLRNLIDQLLSFDPNLRPSASDCLQHPVFSGSSSAHPARFRFPGMPSEFDFYLSYRNPRDARDQEVRQEGRWRIVPDSTHADFLQDFLQSKQHGVCMSPQDIPSQRRTLSETCFFNMSRSKGLGIILSRFAVNCDAFSVARLEKTSTELPVFLIEIRLAMELRARGLLEDGVFLIAIGDSRALTGSAASAERCSARESRRGNQEADEEDVGGSYSGEDEEGEEDCVYAPFFLHHGGELIGKASGCLPDRISGIPLKELESRVVELLRSQGLGKPVVQEPTLREIFNYLLDLPTLHVAGRRVDAFYAASHDLLNVLNQQRGHVLTRATSLNSSRPTTSAVFQRMLSGRLPTPDAHSRVPTNWLKDQEAVHVPPSPLHELTITDVIVAQHRPPSSSAASASASPTRQSSPPGKARRTASMGHIPEHRSATPHVYEDDEVAENEIQFINDSQPMPMLLGQGSNSWKHPQMLHKSFSATQAAAQTAELPFFTEIAHVDKSKTEATMQFMWEKLEVKETEICNMQQELALKDAHLREQQLEIRRLRALVRVTDPRQAESP